MVGEWHKAPFEKLLIEPVRNGIYKTKGFHGRGAKIVNMGELFAHPRLRAVPMKRVELNESERSRFLLSEGDLIFARRSLTAEGAGKCSVVLELDEATTFESSIIRARPDPEKANPLYLYYFFNSPSGFHSLDTIRRQVAVAGITGGDLAKLEIPTPPLTEQRAIAHILGTLDDKIELNRRRNKTLEAMARALIQDWFVDFGPVRAKMAGQEPYLAADLWQLFPDRLDIEGKPEGWTFEKLGDFVEIFDSRRVPLSGKQRAERKGPYPYHGAAGVMDSVDDFLFDGIYVLLGEDGSVVRADGRPYTQYVWGKFWVNNHAHVLRGKGISNETLLIFLNQCDVARFVTGAVQPKLSQGNLKAIPFLNAGQVLLTRFGEFVDPLFAQIRDATEESRTLAQLRDTLLPKLISGELRIADAEKFIERGGL